MKKLITILFLIEISINAVNAQVDYTKFYHNLINQAEIKIVEDEYNEALDLYLKAFKAVPHAFVKDYYNATVCAIKIQKFDTSFVLMDSLVIKGVNKSIFTTFSIFNALKNKPQWQAFLLNFEKSHQLFLNKKNVQLERILKGIQYSDQEFRAKPNSYQEYSDTIKKIDKNNVRLLKNLIEKYGFPNENLIGRENPMEDNIPSFIVFFHQCQKMSQNTEDYDFTSIQIEAVKKGELDPHFLAEWLSHQAKPETDLRGWGIFQITTPSGKKSPFAVMKTSLQQKEDINKKRVAFGLETIAEFNRKAIFALKETDKTKIFAFKRYAHLSILQLSNSAEFDKMFSKMESIEQP